MHSRRSFVSSVLGSALASSAATDPAGMTAAEAVTLIRQRKLTPLELTEACLKRIENGNSRLNAFITVLSEEARKAARALKPAAAETQPLHGIPLALKDLYDTAGIRTTAASAQWKDRVPSADATVVRRLREAGAVLAGKANMDEFAYNFTSETSAFGVCRNPWNPECSPGGSSGGSAVAVATGMSLIALGSDTGGSIRLPAALCGITGFKPTYGIVPADGVAPLAWSLDHVGPMTRTAVDAALVFEGLSGRKVIQRPVKELRIGILQQPYGEGIDAGMKKAMGVSISTLRRLVREVRDVEVPPLPSAAGSPLPMTYSTVIFAEAYAFHRTMLEKSPGKYNPATRATIELGKGLMAAEYIDARRMMERLRASAKQTLFRDADLLVTPTAPGSAFRLGSDPDLLWLRNTAPWNLNGLPSISIPCGFSESGLPLGVQIIGPPNADDTVLSLAMAFQRETGFHRRTPSV